MTSRALALVPELITPDQATVTVTPRRDSLDELLEHVRTAAARLEELDHDPAAVEVGRWLRARWREISIRPDDLTPPPARCSYCDDEDWDE